MIDVNGYDDLVAARVLDFLSPAGIPWQRRLWSIGTVLLLEEVLEASEAVQSSILSEGSFRQLRTAAHEQIGRDRAVGNDTFRETLRRTINTDIRFQSADFLSLSNLLQQVRRNYLANWCQLLAAIGAKPGIERSARMLASHFLDSGFSREYLSEWWTDKIQLQVGTYSLVDLLTEAETLLARPKTHFEVMVAFHNAPGTRRGPMPPEWRDAKLVSQWLNSHGNKIDGGRVAGGLLLTIQARDVWAAIHEAIEIVERVCSRVLIGTKVSLRLCDSLWVAGEARPFPVDRPRRGVDVKALYREHQLYVLPAATSVDNAFELIGPLDNGPAAVAVATGWSALEALLVGPGYGNDRVVAANRLADIVACSYVRTELNALAYAHNRNSTDGLAAALDTAANSHDRARLIEKAIRSGTALTVKTRSDTLAVQRVRDIIDNPRQVLKDIQQHVSNCVTRLYRQRNLVLHWGKVNAVALEASLRTAAPLIGAGFDRIGHAWLVHDTTPLELAARAHISISLIGSTGCELSSLLD